MIGHLQEFFKDTPLGIKSVLEGAVHLAEKVNSRTDLSGKAKTELVVKTLVEFLGEGNPELVALVEGVIPGVLDLVVSTARGKYMLKQVTSCLPATLTLTTSCLCPQWAGLGRVATKDAAPAAAPAAAAAEVSSDVEPSPGQDPANVSSLKQRQKAGVWAWVRSPFFRTASPAASPVEASPAVTLREATPAA